jgi:cobalt-precorrin-5B (C1)-methyltransferase
LKGADVEMIERVMNAKTTNEIHDILLLQNLSYKVYESILKKMVFHLNYRVLNKIEIGVVVFSNESGILMQTGNTVDLINELGESSG